jgi:hypothetical protein
VVAGQEVAGGREGGLRPVERWNVAPTSIGHLDAERQARGQRVEQRAEGQLACAGHASLRGRRDPVGELRVGEEPLIEPVQVRGRAAGAREVQRVDEDRDVGARRLAPERERERQRGERPRRHELHRDAEPAARGVVAEDGEVVAQA